MNTPNGTHFCSGNGQCDRESGKCVCDSCYVGLACKNKVLGQKNCGKPQMACPKMCSGHGYCDTKIGKCSCTVGYTGLDCAQNSCPGNCSSHGTCNAAAGQCECDKEYYGSDCSKRQCPVDCAEPKGTCDAETGTCMCRDGYTGPDCNEAMCKDNCNGRGICNTFTGTCQCKKPYAGTSCAARICPNSCSGPDHGECLENGECKCTAQYEGKDCSKKKCLKDLGLECSGEEQGTCNAYEGTCVCKHLYFGDKCNKKFCPNSCSGHGKCVEEKPGPPSAPQNETRTSRLANTLDQLMQHASQRTLLSWMGSTAAESPPKQGTCLCDAGLGGSDCSKINQGSDLMESEEPTNDLSKCPGRCGKDGKPHGTCDEYSGECRCEQSWQKDDCSFKLCPNSCMGHGVCNNANGVCKCHKGFAGKDCSEFHCEGGDNCSGHGKCDSFKKKCICWGPWGGAGCEKAICPNDCYGNGECNAEGKCACKTGFVGEDCSEKKCPTACGHGKCNPERQVCVCDKGWSGDQCDTAITKCARKCPVNSKCNPKTRKCECESPFYGRMCDVKRCPGDCSGRGACNPFSGTCNCFGGWAGDACTESKPELLWGYSNEGGRVDPSLWGSLSHEFKKCASGSFQSPVDLPPEGMMPFFYDLTFNYSMTKGYRLLNNGRFLAMLHPPGNSILVGEHHYELKNVTVHSPSEHMIGKVRYQLELQLHHEDSFGNLASVAILFKAVSKLSDKFYTRFAKPHFWGGRIPHENHTLVGEAVDLTRYTPQNKDEKHYYVYQGSYTHPPCHEGVQWFVMHEPQEIQQSDIQRVLEATGENSRPVQASLLRRFKFF